MFAEEGDREATLAFYCFDVEVNKLHKQIQMPVTADMRFTERQTLSSQIPCVLLPSTAGASDATATKVGF